MTVLNHLDSGALVNSEAAALLGISVRQFQRLHSAYRDHGVAGLAHGNHDRPAHNAIDAAIAARVVELAKDKYQGSNHQHLTEMLAENDGIEPFASHRAPHPSRGRHLFAAPSTGSQTPSPA